MSELDELRAQVLALQSELARQRETTLTPEEANDLYSWAALEHDIGANEYVDRIAAKLKLAASSPKQSAPEGQ